MTILSILQTALIGTTIEFYQCVNNLDYCLFDYLNYIAPEEKQLIKDTVANVVYVESIDDGFECVGGDYFTILTTNGHSIMLANYN